MEQVRQSGDVAPGFGEQVSVEHHKDPCQEGVTRNQTSNLGCALDRSQLGQQNRTDQPQNEEENQGHGGSRRSQLERKLV